MRLENIQYKLDKGFRFLSVIFLAGDGIIIFEIVHLAIFEDLHSFNWKTASYEPYSV